MIKKVALVFVLLCELIAKLFTCLNYIMLYILVSPILFLAYLIEQYGKLKTYAGR